MVDTNALRGVIASRRKTQKDVADAIGKAPKTFYDKMKKGVFDSDEIAIMIDYLDIEDPMPIFFADKLT